MYIVESFGVFLGHFDVGKTRVRRKNQWITQGPRPDLCPLYHYLIYLFRDVSTLSPVRTITLYVNVFIKDLRSLINPKTSSLFSGSRYVQRRTPYLRGSLGVTRGTREPGRLERSD